MTNESTNTVNTEDGRHTEELIYSNDEARVLRRTLADGSKVIVKHAISMQAIRRLTHEVAILERLAHLQGVPKLAGLVPEPNAMVLQDEGGISLTSFLRGNAFSATQLIDLGIALSRILSGVHKAGVIHKDTSPDNILINVVTRQPTLIDFNISEILEEQNAEDSKGELAGTLPYMSPEQTGRSGRASDQRSDLYSLGVTLYEVATRRRPFLSEDVLELVHDHLARVPDAPSKVNEDVPQVISDVIMRLLEKEPERRYQSAEGLLRDLSRIGTGLQSGNLEGFKLGQFDFGDRLSAPSRLIGREPELAVLSEALARCGKVGSSGVLVSGPAGVGKTALLAELKPLAAASKAFYAFHKFDQSMKDSATVAVDGMQSLGRQILAESEEKLAHYRERILACVGKNLGVGPLRLPEFELLLGKHPAVEFNDATDAEKRSAQVSLAILRAIASAERPVVLVYDDIQWAPSVCLRILDSIVDSPMPIPGVLFVCSHRTDDVGGAHEWQKQIDRWKFFGVAPRSLTIENLTLEAATDFIAAMLRTQSAEVSELARVLSERTGNNPYSTVELINALRHDGVLTRGDATWEWDATAIRRHIGHSDIADLLNRRIGKLRAEGRLLLSAMACLGGVVEGRVLEISTGLSTDRTLTRLAPAVHDGLLMVETVAGEPVFRFANERVRQAVVDTVDVAAREALQLKLARQLAARIETYPELGEFASDQYLSAASLISDETERRFVLELFVQAAKRFRVVNAATAHNYLSAALALLKVDERPQDAERVFLLEVALHRSLFALGKLEECDALYESLAARAQEPLKLVAPVRMQMYALNNRRRFPESLALGLNLLERVGFTKPADLRADIAAGFERLTAFYQGEEKLKDFERPEAKDERVAVWSMIVPHTTTPAYHSDLTTFAWLVLNTHKLWVEYGPSPNLLGGIASAAQMLVSMREDYQGGYVLGRHIVEVGEARNYQPNVSYARCMFAIGVCHWIEPLENTVAEFHRARADLVSIQDDQFFLSTFVSIDLVLDSSRTIDAALTEVDSGLNYAARSRNLDFKMRFQPRKQLILALRGETKQPGSFEDEHFDEVEYMTAVDPSTLTAWTFHVVSAIGAAIFGDMEKVLKHCEQAMPLNAKAPGYYHIAILRVLNGVALCEKARALPEEERSAALQELDENCLRWITARAVDSPVNYLHLQRWLEAERAWVADSIWNAGAAFDAAVKEAQLHDRPWHRALITERAAIFHMHHRLDTSGRALLTQAFELYTAWGAAGKVRKMRREHPFLRAGSSLRTSQTVGDTLRGTTVDAEMVDMMAVLRASQALSSETNLSSLTEQVGTVLSAMTGATRVQLIVKSADGNAWVMARSLTGSARPVTIEQASADGEIPLSVFKYVERTGQELVIEDLGTDERFNADPYALSLAQCSMMLVPVLKQGQLNGMLMLENDQRRSAFSTDRVDAVAMIAGQLSVSFDNALLYASLEQRVAERTAQVRQKTADINAMLQNMPQGVLAITPDGSIHPEYSAYLATILETQDIAGRNVMDLLFANTSLGADALSSLEATIGACIGEDAVNFEFNSHLLITDFDMTFADGRVKSLALTWSAICGDNDVVEKVMLCVRDVTELKRLETEANDRKRELQMIAEVLPLRPEKFRALIDGARGFIADNRRVIQAAAKKDLEVISLLLRNMHTLKGNARTLGMVELTNLVHVVEQSYEELRNYERREWNAARLLRELDRVGALVQEYAHINDDVLGRKNLGSDGERHPDLGKEVVEDVLGQLSAVASEDAAGLRIAIRSAINTLKRVGAEPLSKVLGAILDSLPALAKQLGKEPPKIRLEDHGLLIRPQAKDMLCDLFTHLLCNSVDHGIEEADERRARGKSVEGQIALDVASVQGHLVICLSDDGRGLAMEKIRTRGLSQGLITNKGASDYEVAQLIFRSGFSTAERVTEISGRGVGMDAARAFLAQAGGNIDIRLLDDKEGAEYRAFEVLIDLPEEFAVERRRQQ